MSIYYPFTNLKSTFEIPKRFPESARGYPEILTT